MSVLETIVEPAIQPTVQPTIRDERDLRLEPLYKILIHNDDVTPFAYVIHTLCSIFLLSEELADHIAWTAHTDGVAVVLIRARPEAEKLVKVAHATARLAGYPLTFSLEPAE
ncbi:MAG: ATP-dependent Clp protease adaptor ClpS [Caldilineaceae bacterium]|nr:ATP-dependent Clp protease adaptor ClpS [Caldilineaceae bacterium]